MVPQDLREKCLYLMHHGVLSRSPGALLPWIYAPGFFESQSTCRSSVEGRGLCFAAQPGFLRRKVAGSCDPRRRPNDFGCPRCSLVRQRRFRKHLYPKAPRSLPRPASTACPPHRRDPLSGPVPSAIRRLRFMAGVIKSQSTFPSAAIN